LAAALAAGRSNRAAAAEAGVSERTVGARMADPAFRRLVAELRSRMVDRAVGRLSDGMVEAADGLRALLTARSPAIRLAAARALLELAGKVRAEVELEERVADLERLLEGDDGNAAGQPGGEAEGGSPPPGAGGERPPTPGLPGERPGPGGLPDGPGRLRG
jgi:HEAT repeat protein